MNLVIYSSPRGVEEGAKGGSAPLLKTIKDFLGGSASLLRTSSRPDKFITTHFPKEKKGKVRSYQKKNARTLCLFSPSSNTFIYTGLTGILLSYLEKWAWLKVWSTYFLQYNPPCYSFRTTPLSSPDEIIINVRAFQSGNLRIKYCWQIISDCNGLPYFTRV